MDFSGLFVGFISWRMQQNFCKFSLLQLLYIGGYANLRENRNNSTRSPLHLRPTAQLSRSLVWSQRTMSCWKPFACLQGLWEKLYKGYEDRYWTL